MLALEDVNVYYGKKQVLYNINLELKNGIYGLIGENGAGKTTLIETIMGLISVKHGKIKWNGKCINELGSKYYCDLGYMPQFPVLYEEFYPEEFLYYMAALKGIKRNEYKKYAEQLLEFVGLDKEKNKKIGAFSGGMRQRLGIAQALLNDPKLLILDEPTAGLDPRERIRFRNIISELSKDKIVLLATHILSDIESIADQILFVSNGRIIKKDKGENLIKQLEGKVKMVCVDEEEYFKLNKEILSNVVTRFEEGAVQYIVRGMIGEFQNAKNAQATLEDVFLYYIRNTEAVSNDKIGSEENNYK